MQSDGRAYYNAKQAEPTAMLTSLKKKQSKDAYDMILYFFMYNISKTDKKKKNKQTISPVPF